MPKDFTVRFTLPELMKVNALIFNKLLEERIPDAPDDRDLGAVWNKLHNAIIEAVDRERDKEKPF